MVDQCKQRGVLCHIGLVRDHSGSVEKQHLSEISTIRKTNKHRTW